MDVPTIRQVAELAGVSTATVSRTLSGADAVGAETRARVMQAVQATGFVRNAQASAFRRRSSRSVILLVRDIGNPFYLEMYKGVEEAAVDAGYTVLMGDARDDDARITHYVDMVRARHADGLILMVGRFPEPLLRQAGTLPPLVVALEVLPGLQAPTVRIDNAAAAHVATTHLLGLGHRRVAHIMGPMPDGLSAERLRGYRAALAHSGVAFDPALVQPGDFGLAAGRAAVRRLSETGTAFTAIFAASDQMAVGAIAELRLRGRLVPDDVSVVGFDDIVLADALEPPLTTIHQPRQEIGHRAMELMVARLDGLPPPSADLVMPTRLVVRRSTAIPPGARA